MEAIKKLWRNNKGFLLFVSLMFVFRSAVADWNLVPSSSMNPTLISGDRVIVNKLAYSLRVPFTLQHIAHWSAPARGDVVTFDSPRDEVNLIKRVVAVAGDVVSMRDNTLTVNGYVIERTLLEASRLIPTESGLLNAQIWKEEIGGKQINVARIDATNRFRDFDAVQIPAGHVMVLGDSRDNSNDSRFIGFIDTQRITGQAVRVAMSHNYDMLYLPRTDRWWLAL
jgi:signal peptidase I